MTDAPSKPPLRWFESFWFASFVNFFACAAPTGAWMFFRYTIDDSLSLRIQAAVIWALFIGGLGFTIFVLPFEGIVLLVFRWLRSPPRWRTLILTLPSWAIVSMHLAHLAGVENERIKLERIIGGSMPPKANLILALHGSGPADHRSLWLIEGTSEDFDRFVAERGWMAGEEQDLNYITEQIRTRIKKHFSDDPPWNPDLIFRWGNIVDPVPGPLENSCLQCLLLADKERKRWVVYVMD